MTEVLYCCNTNCNQSTFYHGSEQGKVLCPSCRRLLDLKYDDNKAFGGMKMGGGIPPTTPQKKP
jgi:hypothetical protein